MDEHQRRALALESRDEETLATLANDESEEVREAVAFNRGASALTLAILGHDVSPSVRRSVARNPNSPVQTLIVLASDKDDTVRWALACNAAYPAELLESLALDPSPHVRGGVAGNPKTTKTVLESLARDMHNYVRSSVARNPNTPKTVLESLAHDDYDAVRIQVASDLQIPVEILRILASDPSWQVRAAVAKNVSLRADCPTELIRVLARDRTKSVRLILAQMPDLPTEIVEELSAQGFVSDVALKEGAESHRTSVASIRVIKSARQRAQLLRSINDPEVLAAFATDSTAAVRLAVIENPNAPDASIMTVLTQCQGNVWTGVNALTVRAAISNPNASEETLIHAASLANATSLTALLQRQPPIRFEFFIAVIALEVGPTFLRAADRSLRERSEALTEEQWRFAAEYKDRQVRQLIAMNPMTPQHLLANLALDPESAVRKAVAENSEAPAHVRVSAALHDG